MPVNVLNLSGLRVLDFKEADLSVMCSDWRLPLRSCRPAASLERPWVVNTSHLPQRRRQSSLGDSALCTETGSEGLLFRRLADGRLAPKDRNPALPKGFTFFGATRRRTGCR
jgi:hypothetical protein